MPISEGKLELFEWLMAMLGVVLEVNKSSWTGDSGCELLSLSERGPVERL